MSGERTIRVMVKGERACFTRPEMKAERVSYDVPTPGAMEGLLKSIYWKPAIRYVIDKIVVFRPVAFEGVRRNEVKSKVSLVTVKKQMEESREEGKNGQRSYADPSIYISNDRTQRASLILKDVRYGIEFHMEQTGLRNEREKQECNPQKKHEEEFLRRCRKGQSFRTPCLGCAEFPADVELAEQFDLSEAARANPGIRDLGFMLYKVRFRDQGHPLDDNWERGIYSDQAESVFYRPVMVDGVIDVEKYRKELRC